MAGPAAAQTGTWRNISDRVRWEKVLFPANVSGGAPLDQIPLPAGERVLADGSRLEFGGRSRNQPLGARIAGINR